jgi:hypothetical protein
VPAQYVFRWGKHIPAGTAVSIPAFTHVQPRVIDRGRCAVARQARYLRAMQLRRSTVVTLAIAGALGGAVAMAPPDGLAGSGQASSTD